MADIQKLYRKNPKQAMQQITQEPPPLRCQIPCQTVQNHFEEHCLPTNYINIKDKSTGFIDKETFNYICPPLSFMDCGIFNLLLIVMDVNCCKGVLSYLHTFQEPPSLTPPMRNRAGERIPDLSCPRCHEEQETLNHCPNHVGL